NGLKQYNATILSVTSGSAGQQAVFAGPGAGSYFLTNGVSTSFGAVAIGTNAAQSMTSAGAEFALGGAYAGQYATTSFAMTGWGEHVIGYDNCSYCSAFGNDTMRDTIGNTN